VWVEAVLVILTIGAGAAIGLLLVVVVLGSNDRG
jgi:hypothetical protein